jgi:cell division protein FtsB
MVSRFPQHDRRHVKARQATVLLLCLGAMTYLALHATTGKHGLEARRQLEERTIALSGRLERLEAVRASLEHEARLLDGDNPDPDIIEEAARARLGFARPGDLVLPEGGLRR